MNVGTNISKKSVKSKIAIKNALKDTLKYAVMALDVKELVIVNLNMLKRNKILINTRPRQSVPNSGFHLVGPGLILVNLV